MLALGLRRSQYLRSLITTDKDVGEAVTSRNANTPVTFT